MDHTPLRRQYRILMNSYLQEKEEKKLYAAQQFSKTMLEQAVSPEELVSFHVAAVKAIDEQVPSYVLDSFDFLLEMMMGYGIAYREHLSLRNEQQQLTSEIEVAAQMQQTLLPEAPPQIDELDIGVISIPAKQMSGDYYNFVTYSNHTVGVTLADIIGKGVPAALCMSMIKYAMDSFYERHLTPGGMLRQLNSIVERNVDASMFITMVYGHYDTNHHRFTYAGAGHEPGFFYNAKKSTLCDLPTKGLALGISRTVDYPEYAVTLNPGDTIVLFSDGVTECRINEQFLERKQLKKMMLKHLGKKAQQLAEEIYDECFHLANFEQHDDHTMIVIRRKCV